MNTPEAVRILEEYARSRGLCWEFNEDVYNRLYSFRVLWEGVELFGGDIDFRNPDGFPVVIRKGKNTLTVANADHLRDCLTPMNYGTPRLTVDIPPGIDPVLLAKADAEADARGQPPRGGWKIGMQVQCSADDGFDFLGRVLERPDRQNRLVVLVCGGPKNGWKYLVHATQIRIGWPKEVVKAGDTVQTVMGPGKAIPAGSGAADAEHLLSVLWDEKACRDIKADIAAVTEKMKREAGFNLPRPMSEGWSKIEKMTLGPDDVLVLHYPSGEIEARERCEAIAVDGFPDRPCILMPDGFDAKSMPLAELVAFRDSLNEIIYDREREKT